MAVVVDRVKRRTCLITVSDIVVEEILGEMGLIVLYTLYVYVRYISQQY